MEENKDITQDPPATETVTESTEVSAPAGETEAEKLHRASKGEKKFKKAISKMGMKQVEGIERFLMYIDAPEVMITGNSNSYVIFGEAKFHDFSNPGGASQYLDKVKSAANALKTDVNKPETIEEVDEGEDADIGDLPEESVKMIMEYTKCSKAKAIAALRKKNGDVVEAISEVS